MPLKEKIEQEDLIIYELFRNPCLLEEFIQNFDKMEWEEPFELSWYQKEFMLDFNNYVSIMAGRSSGKTVSVVALLRWLLLFNVFPNDYSCYLVPNRSQLEPVWTGLVRGFRSNTLLKQFIQPNAGINSGDYKITLLNQASLICAIAGNTGDGRAVIGKHTPFFVVDESGYEPWGTWTELQPTINTFTPGFRLMVAGVPDGRREKSVCYHCDAENSSYSKHQISSDENPRLTPANRQKAIEDYGGEESDDFTHLWLAQHGKPVFSLFDRSTMSIGSDPVYKLVLNGTELQENLTEYITRISTFPGISDRKAKVIIGIDLGYTEPSAIIILYADNLGRFHFHGRITLQKVPYPIQEKLIDLLDTKFNPILLGADKGSAGISVIQHLIQDTQYIHKEYEKRLIPIDFSSQIILGRDTNNDDIKAKTKPFATQVVQDYANNHKLIFSSTDLEMVTELERMTYSKTPTGDIVYKTLTLRGGKRGEDHFTSALLCGILAYYLENEFIESRNTKKKLFRPMWL